MYFEENILQRYLGVILAFEGSIDYSIRKI